MNEHFFKTLKIENFRGIKSLEINDLARVNLFVGKNNCGKTSVLESVFLLTGMSNPELLIRIANWRGIFLTNENDMRDVFCDLDCDKGFSLSATQRGRGRKTGRNLKVTPLYGSFPATQIAPEAVKSRAEGNGQRPAHLMTVDSATAQTLTGWQYDFSTLSPQNDHKARVLMKPIQPNEVQFEAESSANYSEKLAGRFVHSKREGYDSGLIDNMLNDKRKDVILDTLRPIENKIQDIRTGSGGVVLGDIGLEHFIPINLMGDGLIRLLNILASIDSTSYGLLMIDEIENGLHVSSIEHMWKVVMEQSQRRNTQIFIVTHSNDVVEGLDRALRDYNGGLFNAEDEMVACYRLVKHTDDETRAYRYSTEELGQALSSDTDLRI